MAPRDPTPARRGARNPASLVLVGTLAACTSGRHAQSPPPPEPVVHESRTGVPFLMDLPLVGWLFQRRVTVR